MSCGLTLNRQLNHWEAKLMGCADKNSQKTALNNNALLYSCENHYETDNESHLVQARSLRVFGAAASS